MLLEECELALQHRRRFAGPVNPVFDPVFLPPEPPDQPPQQRLLSVVGIEEIEGGLLMFLLLLDLFLVFMNLFANGTEFRLPLRDLILGRRLHHRCDEQQEAGSISEEWGHDRSPDCGAGVRRDFIREGKVTRIHIKRGVVDIEASACRLINDQDVARKRDTRFLPHAGRLDAEEGVAGIIAHFVPRHDTVSRINQILVPVPLLFVLEEDGTILRQGGDRLSVRRAEAAGESVDDLIRCQVDGDHPPECARRRDPRDDPVVAAVVHHEFLPAEEEKPGADPERTLKREEQGIGFAKREREERRTCRRAVVERKGSSPGHRRNLPVPVPKHCRECFGGKDPCAVA